MAGHALEQILGYVPLTGVIQATVSGLPNPLPPKMMTKTREVIGDSGLYTKVNGERRTSKVSKYGSAALSRNLRNVAELPFKCVHSFEKQPIPPLTMQKLRNYDSYDLQRQGKQEVARQNKEFGKLAGNLRIAVAIQTLGNGVVYIDSDNNLLPTSSGAVETHSWGMAASHQNQLNNGTADIITATWNDPTTDIPLQLVNLEERAAQETGYIPRVAFYGKNIPGYVMKNDATIEFLARHPEMNVDWLKNPGQIPQGLLGYKWIPMYTSHFYNLADDTASSLWNADKVVFTPDFENSVETEEWWECVEGSYQVPTTLDIIGNQASLDMFKTVYGMFSYAQLSHDPPGMVNFQGDTFAYILRVPDAIWQAVVAGF